MKMTRAVGRPIPEVLSCGEQAYMPLSRVFSILMTRFPGLPLENSVDRSRFDLEDPLLFELKKCMGCMRTASSPCAHNICSVIGTLLRSSRVPNHNMDPFTDKNGLHVHLMCLASGHGFDSTAEYIQALAKAKYSHWTTLSPMATLKLGVFLLEIVAIYWRQW